jgi:hypothetical protein
MKAPPGYASVPEAAVAGAAATPSFTLPKDFNPVRIMSTKLLVWVFFISAVSGLGAQNLQFGKTKLIDTKTDTVPKGKIWKMEGFVYSQAIVNCPTSGTTLNISDSIVFNGNKMMVRAQRFSGLFENSWDNYAWAPEFFLWEQKTPLWLPAGTTLAAGRGVMYISILEFNEAP